VQGNLGEKIVLKVNDRLDNKVEALYFIVAGNLD